MSRISKAFIAFATFHLIAAVAGQEMEKRGPQGFLGMRGKKYNDDPEQFYKRKPQFFVGVKGKKNAYDFESPELYFKRAPMGFMGMRGKKDLFFDDKRAPMGFVGMRGKKDLYSEEEKRAPMGFVGMRGKKDMFSDEEKRAMGFMGMRGKKELSEEEYFPDGYEYVPKRGSLIGQIDYNSDENGYEFPLLRDLITEYLNKLERPDEVVTDTSEQNEPSEAEHITNEIEKRASVHQFFGVRGKKSLQNKRPYDVSFRGKFIGVRGKKDLQNSGTQEIKFLVDQSGPFPKRKGFFGMRGKKWIDGKAIIFTNLTYK